MAKITVSPKLMSGNILVFVLFFWAKVTGHIDWSWFWITSPLWLPIVLIFSAVFLFVFIGMLAGNKRY